MKTTTWTYGGMHKVTIKAGKVIASDAPGYPVGMVIRPGQMKACGWKTVRKAVQYDAWGRRVG